MTNHSVKKQFHPSPVAPAGQAAEDDTIDLGKLFSTIWRGKWIVGLITTLAILAGGYYAFVVATPLYRSTAVVMLETEQQSVVDLQSVMGGMSGDSSEVNSEVEVLRSRGLIGKVVDRLDLVSDPEFNQDLLPETVMDQIEYRIRTALGIQETELVLPLEEQSNRTRDDVITELLEQITIRNIPQSLVFQITAVTKSPEKSTLIADTMVELYILNQLEVKFEATEQATSWLTDRVAELQVELETAEAKAAEFNASTTLISIESLKAQEIHLKDLRERIGDATIAVEDTSVKETALSAAVSRLDQTLLSNDAQLNLSLIHI